MITETVNLNALFLASFLPQDSAEFSQFLQQYAEAVAHEGVLVTPEVEQNPLLEVTDHHNLVASFMRLSNQKIAAFPSIPDEATLILRAKLHLEETLELIKGLGVTVSLDVSEGGAITKDSKLTFAVTHDADLDEIADGVCDTRVVGTGTALACGMVIGDTMQREVDLNNLYKFRVGADGYRREDGKWVKPSDHPSPRIDKLIAYTYSSIAEEMERLSSEVLSELQSEAATEVFGEAPDGLVQTPSN